MHDINKPPRYYSGTVKEWIEELTTYIYLFPTVWDTIYKEYLHGVSDSGNSDLRFYRNEEGYLRMAGIDAVYLKVTGGSEPLGHEVLDRIGRILSERAEELFYSFLEYTGMDGRDKKFWIEGMKKDIQKSMARRDLSVKLVETLDESAFAGEELYFDLLNDLYIIL